MSTLNQKSRRIATIIALCAGVAATSAMSQPGERHHGRHHHGGGGLPAAIVALKAELNLNASQDAMLNAALASGKAAREAARASRQTVRQLVKEELAKPAPDLAKIAAAQDQVQDAALNARRAVRNQMLQLYATFTPEQIAVVKEAMNRRASRFESFREHMRERFGRN
jgi:Spy/CpxP family protein refolding chaperone